jgi:hypothetical protein
MIFKVVISELRMKMDMELVESTSLYNNRTTQLLSRTYAKHRVAFQNGDDRHDRGCMEWR